MRCDAKMSTKLLRAFLVNFVVLQLISVVIPLLMGYERIRYFTVVIMMLISNFLFLTLLYVYLYFWEKRKKKPLSLTSDNPLGQIVVGLLLLLLTFLIDTNFFVWSIVMIFSPLTKLFSKKSKTNTFRNWPLTKAIFPINILIAIPIILDMYFSFYYHLNAVLHIALATGYLFLYYLWIWRISKHFN